MRVHVVPPVLFALALWINCSSPRSVTVLDASPDAIDGSIFQDVFDGAPDRPSSAPAALSCRPCLYDTECGEGGACVELDPMRAPGLFTCLAACSTVGDPCDASGVAGRCELGPYGSPVCVPSTSCLASRQGARCAAGYRCTGRYSVCATVDGNPVCLAPCDRDSHCEDGFARCRNVLRADGSSAAKACIPDEVIGPERCGTTAVNDRGVGAPCGGTGGRSCPSGLSCVEGVHPAVAGFCSMTCTSDRDCGDGARCLPIGTMGPRCVPLDCACIAGPTDTLLDRALRAGMRSRCDLYFTRSYIDVFPPSVTRDRFRLPIFDRVHRDWQYGAAWARQMGSSMDERARSLSEFIAVAAALRATGDVRDGRVGPVVAPLPSDAPLADAVAQLIETFGGSADRGALRTDAADVPMDLQRALASVLVAIGRVAQARDRGLAHVSDPDVVEHLYQAAPHLVLPALGSGSNLSPLDPFDLGAILGDVRLPIEETTSLAATIESIDWTPFRGRTGLSFEAQTPIGKVVVRDGMAHTYAASDYSETALVVDLGGDDTYLAPVGANASVNNRVSVLIDLGGNDRYTYTERPVPLDAMGFLPSDGRGRYTGRGAGPLSLSEVNRQGAGRLGVGLLYDLGRGADRYRSLRGSQGFGALGIGGLMDDGGDDLYELEAGGQGAGILGIGVFFDAGGNDRYVTWHAAQGFGYVRGVGILYDREGDDEYTARPTPVAYPSPQDMTVNGSLSQGMGFGRRGDFLPDRVNMSGGIGILRDRTGNDRYTCAIFGQGSGYWGGMGLLLDGQGNDLYNGRWYVQGAAAHFAYGALVDGSGRDIHNADAVRQNMTGGAGHDFSTGFLLADGTDDDEYNVPNLALGAGNANGAGFFVDQGGNDTYRAASVLTCGNASLESLTDTGRRMRPTVGIFLDGAGLDTYLRSGVVMDPVGNNATWVQRIHPEALSEIGMGADGTTTTLGL